MTIPPWDNKGGDIPEKVRVTAMNQVLILYQSKSGATEQYARWLGEALGTAPVTLADYEPSMAQGMDYLVCCGGIYGNELAGLKKYKRIAKAAGVKPLYLAVGLRPDDEENRALLLQYNFRKPYPPLFYCQGRLDPETLDQKDRTTLLALKTMLKRKRDTTARDTQLLELLGRPGGYCDRTQLQELVSYVQDSETEE